MSYKIQMNDETAVAIGNKPTWCWYSTRTWN